MREVPSLGCRPGGRAGNIEGMQLERDAAGIPVPLDRFRIGCAGWAIPGRWAERFPGEGSHLERYARVLPAVEIDSSFYRPHRPATYARWAASVPPDFRFAVKLPRAVTHESRLADPSLLADFLAQVSGLGPKLGPLLGQLPPSLAFDPARAGAFLGALRQRFAGEMVWEPRHPSWFAPGAERLLAEFRVARVAADPACVPEAGRPGGWSGLAYYRLHGSPRVYYSGYDDAFLDRIAAAVVRDAGAGPVWCIFDNTAAGEAVGNALALLDRVAARRRQTG